MNLDYVIVFLSIVIGFYIVVFENNGDLFVVLVDMDVYDYLILDVFVKNEGLLS